MRWPAGYTATLMIDLNTNPRLRRLFWVAHYRVTVGFVVAAIAFWLAAPTWSSLALGVLLAVIGEVVRVWAAGHLRKGQEVTRSGPYRFMRHPLYVGSFLIGIGFSVAAADFFVWVLVIGYQAMTLQAAIRLEETTLRSKFGDEFERYRQGHGDASSRRFSFSQMVKNGEHRSLLGLAVTVLFLAIKVLLRA